MKKYLVIILVLFLTSCFDKRKEEREEDLSRKYTEFVDIDNGQYIGIDRSGNVHLVTTYGEDLMIISYQEIERGLIREFTKDDIKRSMRNVKP